MRRSSGRWRRARPRVYLLDGTIQHFEIEGGFVEVSRNTVSILVS